jgi:hypothetical protein
MSLCGCHNVSDLKTCLICIETIVLFAIINGQIKRLQDEDIQSNVLEIVGPNVNTTYITCLANHVTTLGIKLLFLVMIVKNLKKYFTFKIQILDDKNVLMGESSNGLNPKTTCLL